MYFLNLLLLAAAINFSSGPRWVENLDEAKTAALEEEKLILLIFSGSDWCRNCILLDHEVISSAEFHQLAENHLVLLKADFPRKRKNQLPEYRRAINESLAKNFNSAGEFPKVVLMDAREKILLESSYQQGQSTRFLEQLKSQISHD